MAKLVIFENNWPTIGEQKNAIENFHNLLQKEFRHIMYEKVQIAMDLDVLNLFYQRSNTLCLYTYRRAIHPTLNMLISDHFDHNPVRRNIPYIST